MTYKRWGSYDAIKRGHRGDHRTCLTRYSPLEACSISQGVFSGLSWKGTLKSIRKQLNARLGLIGGTFLNSIRDTINHKKEMFLGFLVPELSRSKTRKLFALGFLLPAAAIGIAGYFSSKDPRNFKSAFAKTDWLVKLSTRTDEVCQQLPKRSASQLRRDFKELKKAYRSFFSGIGRSPGLAEVFNIDKQLVEVLPEVFRDNDLEVIMAELVKAIPIKK